MGMTRGRHSQRTSVAKQPSRHWRGLGVLLPLVLFGCAIADGDPPAGYDVARASRVFSAGYQDIIDIYIEPKSVPSLALAGLDGLSGIEPSFSADYGDNRLTLTIDGHRAGEFAAPSNQDLESWGDLTATAIETVRGESQSLDEAGSETVYKAVFGGIVANLDKFSRYAGRDQARENRASRDGFGGIGVRIRIVDEGVRVLSVMENTPAESAGLKAQDLVTHINGELAVGMAQAEVVRRLRGPVRTRVDVTVEREIAPGPLTLTVTRAHIVPQTVTYRAEGKVGYFKVTGFNQDTTKSLRQKILRARRELGKELKGYVLDLRGNPGGLLDQAVSVSDLFVARGRIVSTHGRHPDSHQIFDADMDDLARNLPLAVLINGNSASASEIVAAALQDSRRGVVIGSNSFGKGTVQTVLRLPNDGEFTLTWARFHAPSGYALQRRGVIPDICTNGQSGDAVSVLEKVRSGEITIDRVSRTRKLRPDDDEGRATLRARCPVNDAENELDLQVATALLDDSSLYAQILRGVPETAKRLPD